MLSACNYSMKTISLARRTLPTLGAIPTTTSTRGYSTARHGYQPGEARPERSILITGALGQLGMEIAAKLRSMYGSGSVLVTDIRKASDDVYNAGPYRYLDVLDQKRMEKIVVEHNVDSIVHLSCLLSAIGEKQVDKALMVNNGGTENVLAVAKQHGLSVFCPSTIGAFGSSTPMDNTPNVTIMRPSTIYGVTKVYMELLGEYYNTRYGVDFRSLRLPGVISADTIPGGGTTDYAVDIYRHAIQHPKTPFSCYLRPDSALPMMMIGDCVNGIVSCMEANDADLTQRVYNLGACSFTPEMVTASIQKRIPSFQIEYNVDERQRIADSWPYRGECLYPQRKLYTVQQSTRTHTHTSTRTQTNSACPHMLASVRSIGPPI
eukprot:m.1379431 g.1379431  ORF g.1379431 m.1379431 type:complete len:377 (+) comp24965_c1_seq6:279-1409(+)